MDSKHSLLAALLAAQLVIVAALSFWRGDAGAADAGPLLSFERAAVDRVRVAEADAEVELHRGTDGWQIARAVAGETALPADDSKIAGVLDRLVDAGAPWPVATSEASVRRFEVAADNFQRRIQLYGGDDIVAELFLGTSPGFRKVHARRADDDAVYAITFSNFEVPAAADDWLDKSLLQPAGAVESVSIATEGDAADWTLLREGEGWQLAQLATDRVTRQDEARAVVDNIRDLRVLGVAAQDTEALAAAFTLNVEDAAGALTLKFFQPEPDGEYLVISSRRPGVFRAAMYTVEPLRVARAELIALAPVNEEAGEAEAGPAPEAG